MSYYILCLKAIANQEEGGRQKLIARDFLRFFVISGIEAQVILQDRLLFKTKSQLSTGPVRAQTILQDRLTFKSDDDDFQPAISTTQKRKNLSLKRVKATNRDKENVDSFFNSNKAKGSTSSDFLKNMASSSSLGND
ncbi:unnamed protein product [Rhizophagus irregularis]|nr:unnamed protein product [Rhizophagus irregularis]